MTMVRAAVTERPGLISLGEFPMPDPMPGAVIMKVHYSGICGTDKHTFRGESKQYAGTPHGRDLTYPLICGHENAGEVVATGAEVHDSEGRAGLTMSVETTVTAERIARAREHTGGIGPDIVLNCSGFPSTFVEAIRMVRFGGVVVEAGTFVNMGPVAINPNSDICTKNVSVIGVGSETSTSYLPSMRLMAANLDRLPFDRIVSHRLPLEQAQQALELAQTDAAMKVVMAPHGATA